MPRGVAYEDLGPLREALAEAARTDESNASRAIQRFVELRPGIQDTLKARRHHLITGRRGTGKSTLLHFVRNQLRDDGAPVAVIDMEKFKGRPFPDVLIEILIALLHEVEPPIRWSSPFASWRLRRRFNRSQKELEALLADPQSITRTFQRAADTTRHRSFRGSGVLNTAPGSSTTAAAAAEMSGEAALRTSQSTTEMAQYEELKIERLQQMASALSVELTELVRRASQDRAVIFIDDFYYVRLEDQPSVLNYLQQVCKSTGIWLKVGGVGTRMRPFKDGDPPIGMQPRQDIDPLPLDVTLNEFGTAQRFLEAMLDGVVAPLGLATRELFTDGARSRMVLACGGAVARDYVTLTAAALDAAVERLNKKGAPAERTMITIKAEDVNLAARRRLNEKEEQDLNVDAGPDAARLKERWRDVCDFIREQGDTGFILIRQRDLDEAEWGEDIRQLENLRLLHRIRDAVPNTPNWRGVKTVVFMVDLGQVAIQRLRMGIPSFWESTSEFDKLRRAEWVYGPDWRDRLRVKQQRRARSGGYPDAEENAPLLQESPLTLFDDPAELDTSLSPKGE